MQLWKEVIQVTGFVSSINILNSLNQGADSVLLFAM